jgi:mono/diheme cytochrome c family protein
MKSLITFLAALPLWALAAPPPALSVAPPAEPAAAAGAPFDLSDAARAAIGKKRFGSTCAAYCHGAEGDGGKTASFRARPNFSPADTYKVISEGRRGTDIMPPWGGAFSPEEIWELVAYLQQLAALPPKQ